MKTFSSYLRAVLLSVIAAIIIDAVVNFDQYQAQWAARFGGPEKEEYLSPPDVRPFALPKIEPAVFGFFTR